MAQPLFIGGILMYFNQDSSKKVDLGYAYFCSFGLMLSMLTFMFLLHLAMTGIFHCGMKMRLACSSLIFRKVFLNCFIVIQIIC